MVVQPVIYFTVVICWKNWIPISLSLPVAFLCPVLLWLFFNPQKLTHGFVKIHIFYFDHFISYQCLTCHSASLYLSLSFSGWNEDFQIVCSGQEFRLPVYSGSRIVTFTPSYPPGPRRVLLENNNVGTVACVQHVHSVFLYAKHCYCVL